MLLDHSREYLVWVNTETVSYVSVRRTGDMVDVIEGVRRHQVNLKEPAPSFMTYQAGDVNFFVPRARISEALGELKSGDWVLDADEVRFKVLNVDHRKRDRSGKAQTFRLLARNLSLAYDLRDVITIETPVMVLDTAGVEVKTNWEPKYADLPARVQKITEATVDQLGIRGFLGTYAVTVDREVQVTNKDRIVWYGTAEDRRREAFEVARGRARVPLRYLEIVGYHNPERVDELPVIDAEAKP